MQDAANDLIEIVPATRQSRKQLLPWWMKAFMWIFLVFGAVLPIVVVMGILGKPIALALYGMETYDVFSITGLIITSCFAVKAVVAYGLWAGKPWALQLAMADAIIGILVCCLSMFAPELFATVSTSGSFRLELLLLIPYLIKSIKLNDAWKSDLV
ncbi:MAG: hypothetical protein EOO13_08410 [Chitinophagaceae bacterium]|nr:MAG: hypothetical protein EOO13_08410 [Chitinophagaceae bacterium]